MVPTARLYKPDPGPTLAAETFTQHDPDCRLGDVHGPGQVSRQIQSDLTCLAGCVMNSLREPHRRPKQARRFWSREYLPEICRPCERSREGSLEVDAGSQQEKDRNVQVHLAIQGFPGG